MARPLSESVSSFSIIKGSLIDETYTAFELWDFTLSRAQNLQRLVETNPLGAGSEGWLREVARVLRRRFDPAGHDRPLVELAKAGCPSEVWRPLLLWHMTRNEFLLRDFLIHWLDPKYREGVFRLHTGDVIPYLDSLVRAKNLRWSAATTSRVAMGLLRIATDFGLLRGTMAKEFTSYHLSEESFLYLLHALAEVHGNAERVLSAPDWRMYLLSPEEVERELLRLHQFHRVHYEVAGSLAQLSLPCADTAEFARSYGREQVS